MLIFNNPGKMSLLKTVGKGDQHFLLFPQCFSSILAIMKLSFSNDFSVDMANFELFKQKEFADDSSRKSLKKGRKLCGKRRNYLVRAMPPFLIVFSKDLYCRP